MLNYTLLDTGETNQSEFLLNEQCAGMESHLLWLITRCWMLWSVAEGRNDWGPVQKRRSKWRGDIFHPNCTQFLLLRSRLTTNAYKMFMVSVSVEIITKQTPNYQELEPII